MKKTFVTSMPDHVGAFLKASRCFADLGINLTRVSYNKAVDMYTLFIEAEGEEHLLDEATRRLEEIGYLQSGCSECAVLLVEFKLRDVAGTVASVLELIQQHGINISYISSIADGSGYQLFKMGLYFEDQARFTAFMEAASALCPVRVVDYNKIGRNFDNSLFYISFANELAAMMDLDDKDRNELVIESNLVMQLLDERGRAPQKTFSCIGKFAGFIAGAKGEHFAPRITRHAIGDDLEIILIEPPCGSNTTILRAGEEYLFVDTGYACYREEMLEIFRSLIPDFDTCKKSAFLTHADVDHCGLLSLFDTVYTSAKTAASLRMEIEGLGGYRAKNRYHAPYIRICQILTGYETVDMDTVRVICGAEEPLDDPLTRIGTFSFGPLTFEVYEGGGGHIPGETVLIDRAHSLAFTGDIFINLKDTIQTAYNRLAPYLMVSVDTDPAKAAEERKALMGVLGKGEWNIFSGHGLNKHLTVE